MLATILNWLNTNQGLLALVSILISVLGFFITNRNINQKQSQKAGNDSQLETAGRDLKKKTRLSQTTGNNSFAQQAGRDIKG